MDLPVELKKWLDPITAVAILLFIAFAVNAMLDDKELKQEISQSCGWAEEDYKCICEKSEVVALNNLIEQRGGVGLIHDNSTVVR